MDRGYSVIPADDDPVRPSSGGFILSRTWKFAIIAAIFIALVLILGLAIGLRPSPAACSADSMTDFSEDPTERANQVLTACPLIDTHNDLPYAIRNGWKDRVFDVDLFNTSLPLHTNIPFLQQGHVSGQMWSIYVGCNYQDKDAVRAAQEQVDVVYQLAEKYPDFFRVTTTADELEYNFENGFFSSLMGIEGGHKIDNSLASIRAFRRQGVRYMTLTHNCNTIWAESCCPEVPTSVVGLTSFGKDVVREMNRIGMLVDLSHTSLQTMMDALNVTVAPVMFSHSNAFTLCPTERNVRDQVLSLLPANGGVVCITFVPGFVNCTNSNDATIEQVADHIEYIVSMTSFDNVCLGGDFDGISQVIPGLENVSKYPALIAELYRRGWTDENVIKLVGQNLIRVIRATEEISNQMSNVIPGQSVLNNVTEATGCRTVY